MQFWWKYQTVGWAKHRSTNVSSHLADLGKLHNAALVILAKPMCANEKLVVFAGTKKKTVPRFSKETFEWLRINLSKPPPSLKMPGLLALAQAPMAQLKVIPSMQKSAKKCIPERLWLNFFFCSLLYVQTVPPNISFQLLPWQIRSWHGSFHSGKVDQLTEATNFWASPSSSRAKSQPWAPRGFL